MGGRTTAAVVIVALAAGIGVGIAAGRHDKPGTATTLLTARRMSACGRAVVEDWLDNLRVDHLYPVHCYEEALAALPSDLTSYTGAPTAIQRALFYARAHGVGRAPVTVATIRAGSTVVLSASRARPGDWISCVKEGNRVRAQVQSRGRGVGLSADGLTYSATLDVTTSKSGRVVARCR